MKKICLITIVILVLLMGSCFAASRFSDVNGTKYETAVTLLNNNGIIDGFPDGTFKPNSNVTRAQMCKLLVEALKLTKNNSSSVRFSDVNSSDWFYDYVKTAVDNSIVIGYTDGTFKPNDDVKYSELFTMIIRAMKMENQISNKSDWPNAYINFAASYGLLSNVSYSNVSYPATRGEVSVALYNMVNRLGTETAREYGFVTSVTTKNKVTSAKIEGTTYTVSSKSDDFLSDSFAVFDRNTFDDEIKLVTYYNVKDLDSNAVIVTYASGKQGDQDIKINGSSKYNDYYSSSALNKYSSYAVCLINVDADTDGYLEITKYAMKSSIKDIKLDVGDRIVEDPKYKVFLVFRGLSEDDEVKKGRLINTVEYVTVSYKWAFDNVAGVSLPKSVTLKKGTRYTPTVPKDQYGYTFKITNLDTKSFVVNKDTVLFIDYEEIDQGGYAGSNMPLIDRVSESELKQAITEEWYQYLNDAYGSDLFDVRIENIKVKPGDDKDEVKFEIYYEVKPASNAVMNRFTIPDGEIDEETGWVVDKHNVGILYTYDDSRFYIDYSSVGTGW